MSLTVYINDAICIQQELKQFRFPRSKRKRIRNKWKKRIENWRSVEKHIVFREGNNLYVSSKQHAEIMASDLFKKQQASTISTDKKG